MAELTEEQIKEVMGKLEDIRRGLGFRPNYQDELDMAADAGTNNLDFRQVKEGEIIVVSLFSAYNDTSAPTRIRLGYYNRTRYLYPRTVPAPLVSETVELLGPIILTPGMWLRARFEGCTDLDDIYALAIGYFIKQ